MKALKNRVLENSRCTGFGAFLKDFERLETADSMCGLCQIRAEVWLEKLGELSDDELSAYIERYQAGWLDPFEGYGI